MQSCNRAYWPVPVAVMAPSVLSIPMTVEVIPRSCAPLGLRVVRGTGVNNQRNDFGFTKRREDICRDTIKTRIS